MKKFFMIIMSVLTITFIGCANGVKSSDNPTTVTEYESFSGEIPKYKLEDFENIVVGESTMCDLHKTVGVAPYSLPLTLRMIDVYPLDNGKYYCVTYIDYQKEGRILDFTIDEIEISDKNPAVE